MTPVHADKVSWRDILTTNVIVSALGYFVDIYDLVLFSIVRVQSLADIGVPTEEHLNAGVYLLNSQMLGMLVGGVLWGVLGDKRGRVSVLYSSILLYSLANLANAFVTDVNTYAVLRFIAGIGLAGELGAAVTLVSETMRPSLRSYGTSIVSAVGVAGAALAAIVGAKFDWQTAYIVGGVLGLLLLVARFRVLDSTMFKTTVASKVSRGNFFMLFANRDRALRYVCCILIGVFLWFVVGILGTFSPEICKELGATGPVSAGTSIMSIYLGLIFGDMASGITSQILRSRKKVVLIFVSAASVLCITFTRMHGQSPEFYYWMFAAIGIFTGYWAIMVTIAAEQFGTNLRATAATSIPNFIRGSVVAVTAVFQWLGASYGLSNAAMIVCIGCTLICYLALLGLPETFARDLDFNEE